MHKPSNRGKPRNRLRVGANEKITRKCLTLCVTAIPIAIFAALLTFGPFFVSEWAGQYRSGNSPGSGRALSGSHVKVASASKSGSIFSSFFGNSVPVYQAKAWSHLTKNEDFKIFVYDLPEKFNSQVLRESWRCGHHMFAAEVAIHKYLLASSQRTLDPKEAHLFYIPVYTTCKCTTFAGNGPDPWFGRTLMSEVINHVSTTYPYWNKRQGRDHVVVATHDYGACYDYLRSNAKNVGIVPELKNAIILSTLGDRNLKECFNTRNHITIPTYLPVAAVGGKRMRADWTKAVGVVLPLDADNPKFFDDSKRDKPCFFWGALEWTDSRGNVDSTYSHGVRQELRRQYKNDPYFTLKHVTRDGDGKLGMVEYAEQLKQSVFCLAPAGFAPWSARIYEAIHYGCIPVIIADTIILPFDDQLNWRDFSIKISEHDLKVPGKLKEILQSLTAVDIKRKQSALKVARKAIMFQFPGPKPKSVSDSNFKGYAPTEVGGAAFDYIMRELHIKAHFREVTTDSPKIRQAARLNKWI